MDARAFRGNRVDALRDGGRRIILMSYGHADEEAYYEKQMD